MKNPVENAPLLTNLSTFLSSPKWTLSRPRSAPARSYSKDQTSSASIINPLSCIDVTSKFRRVASACKFGTATRFVSAGGMRSSKSNQPGPGAYSHEGDYSAAPYHSVSNITFGKGERPFSKLKKCGSGANPGPGRYDIRGKYRDGGFTFDQKGVSVNHRHGWYYDPDVRAARGKPGPGSYNPVYPFSKSDRKFSFGHGDRPDVQIAGSRDVPAPGQYEIKSRLGGREYSFTTTRSSFGSIHQQPKDAVVGPLCGQPTQFSRR